MALTKSSIAAGALDKTVSQAILALAQNNVMLPLVTRQILPIGSNVAQWSDETPIASSSVDAKTEGSDQSTVVSLTSAARTATMSEHVIRSDVGDLVQRGSVVDITGMGAEKNGAAVGAKLDSDLVTLLQSFVQVEAGAGTALTISHIFGALRQLRAQNAPFPFNLVLSPKGVWGAKGLRSLLIQAGNTTTNTAVPHSLMGSQGQDFLNRGFVDSIGGIDVYWSNEINEDISSGGDAGAGMFSAGAIGCAIPVEGLLKIEPERNASARSTELVSTGVWGEIEIKDTFGVYILHDVS